MESYVSRRGFLGGAMSASLFGYGCEFIPNGSYKGGKPNLVFGVVSDIHVRLKKGGEELLPSNDTRTFLQALKWFDKCGVDAVCIAGDMADSGMKGELKHVAAAWNEVFPGDTAADGRRVERVFVYGNHDWNGKRRGSRVFEDEAVRIANSLGIEPEKQWAEVFGDEWKPVYLKKVKGYSFVGAHWCVMDCNGKAEKCHRGLEEFYAAHADELSGSKPFFHIQHPHPRNTVHGPLVWGQDDGTTGAILSKFPNAVAFSGHSHTPITDEMSVWQGDFTSIGCASLRYLDHMSTFHPAGYENAEAYRNPDADAIKCCPTIVTGENLREAMLVKVYDDAMVITRINVPDMTPLGADWCIPLPVRDGKPFAFDTARARAKRLGEVPRFQPGSALMVKLGAYSMRGRDRKRVPCPTCEFTLPSCQCGTGRTFEYRVDIIGEDGRPLLEPLYALPNDYAVGPASKSYNSVFPFSISRTRIPQGGRVSFKVTPVSRWGLEGPAIEDTLAMSAMPYEDLPARGICAHRGDMGHFPEDTVPAIESAAKKGAQMVEFDVCRCRTGEFVVMHDNTVDRTTNGHGKIEELAFDYIRSLDAGSKFDPKFAGTKVPTLEEALGCLPKKGLWINVHCKDAASAIAAAKEIRRQGRTRQAFVAVQLDRLAKAREEVPEVMGCDMTRTGPWNRAWTPEQTTAYCQQAAATDCRFVQLIRPCKPAELKALKEVCGKVNYFHSEDQHHVTPDMIPKLFAMGVDFILCNDIDPMLAAL